MALRSLPVPVVHSVHFYEDDLSLIQRLSGIVSTALEHGHGVLLVVTPEHRRQLGEMLAVSGVNVRSAQVDGRLSVFDARKTLDRFMTDGLPDADLFFQTVGRVVAAARQDAQQGHSSLTVFGEMVSVLWEQGNKEGALVLERLWNDLLSERAFHLHCAYPRALVQTDAKNFANICAEHNGCLSDPTPHPLFD